MKLKPCPNEPGAFLFNCPGCNDTHRVTTQSSNSFGAKWGFNGNTEMPTFSPSILFRSGHYVGREGMNKDGGCWCTYNKEQLEKGEKPSPFSCTVCHSFVTDGKIQFLSDSTHHLTGQTVELPEIN